MADGLVNSSSSSFQSPWNYDVCFSFRDRDTLANFTGHLYHAFCQQGIRAFMVEKPDEEGEEISEAAIKGMEQSRISIVIFSENYAHSTWCLDQLVKILGFMKTNRLLVIPIFYQVDPLDVRLHRGSFARALDMHKRRFEAHSERVLNWKMALSHVADISGWLVAHGYEYEYIQKITEDVICRLEPFGLEASNLRSTMMGDPWINSSSFSYPSSFQHPWKFDVFFSFRDPDTRRNFTSHLYQAFFRKGIDTLIIDKIERGAESTPTVYCGIEQSRISIIIFSENYAESIFCLQELTKIMECKRMNGQLVIPVFYRVDPSAVRYQRASFARALASHEAIYGPGSEEVQKWRLALKEAAELTGWPVGDDGLYEFQHIERITEDVIGKLKSLGAEAGNLRPSESGKSGRDISNWKKLKLLGSGSFGSVYEGVDEHGLYFAIKEVSLLDQGNKGKQSVYQLMQEIDLLSQLEHKNIVQYYGTEMDESNLYVFLELATKGDLKSFYETYPIQYPQVSAYTRQILHGLKYLHDQNVIHRDIKCANILVDADGSVKLANFGLTKAIKFNDIKSCKGIALWMAPEVVRGKNQGYGLPADIWSLGCTVLEMLTGKLPYDGFEPLQALFRIENGELPHIPKAISRDARDFILKCLKVNPSERLAAAQLLNHSFVM